MRVNRPSRNWEQGRAIFFVKITEIVKFCSKSFQLPQLVLCIDPLGPQNLGVFQRTRLLRCDYFLEVVHFYELKFLKHGRKRK